MGHIRVVVQDEQGKETSTGVDLPSSMLPHPSDTRFICLRFVDPYGDAIFNRLQIPIVVEELNLLKGTLQDQEEATLLERVKILAERCRNEPHLYLRFIGD